VRILFATLPGYGLTLPVVPLMWAARAAGHEVLVATSGSMVTVVANAGLPVVDVCPERDLWAELTAMVRGEHDGSEEMRLAAGQGNPFGFFALTMTEGTVEAGRDFAADLLVYTSDHPGGPLAATALGIDSVDMGNRVSWSMRDAASRDRVATMADEQIPALLRERLGIPDDPPKPLARLDVRPPSMGGLSQDEPDARDGIPWWPMRYVPYNGGAAVPAWAHRAPERPRVCVTLGTVVPSMSGVSTLAVVIEALGALDVDVVVAAGDADLADLGELPANVSSLGFLPLSVILPSCSLIVHHGGSGTAAAPLHYGVPQLVLPSFADNPMSAQRIADRGVGLQHDPETLDETTATEMITRLLAEPEFSRAAREVAAEMASMPSPADVIARVAERIE
jgi:UDP:flavonoid glycosyltransferase YjiC (YdhE family)